jgi:hypothetical protein
VRTGHGLAAQLPQQVEIVRDGEHMDRIGEQQNVMSVGQRVADEVAFDHVDPCSLRLGGNSASGHLAGTRQLE